MAWSSFLPCDEPILGVNSPTAAASETRLEHDDAFLAGYVD